MIFEDALKLMREGKKLRRPMFSANEYYIGCLQGINPKLFGEEEGNLDFYKTFAIVKMKGKYAFPEHRNKDAYWFDQNILSMPDFIFIGDICANDWEIVEDEK